MKLNKLALALIAALAPSLLFISSANAAAVASPLSATSTNHASLKLPTVLADRDGGGDDDDCPRWKLNCDHDDDDGDDRDNDRS